MTNNYNGCYCQCRQRRCYNIVLAIIGAILALAIGIIIGAVFAEAIITALAAVIAVAAILVLLFVLFLVLRICNTDRC